MAGPPVGQTLLVDGESTGRAFEGLGALSAGASSRLLIDYPEPQRSQILDFLFKPAFGAAFQHLKVEIGGDINSTDGTEPSYARTREEFASPQPENFQRGYEWWLMREARKRNPAICLDILQWGVPDWIGDRDYPDSADPNQLTWQQRVPRNRKKFYTQDNADYIARFIRAAKKYHRLTIDYCGVWNEMSYDTDWIKRLRRTLDQQELQRVQIVAADQTGKWGTVWEIGKDMLNDKALMDAVAVIGSHYPGMQANNAHRYESGTEARQTGKRIWSSEDGPWRGDWTGAGVLAKLYNRNYIRGKMTKTTIWSLVSSYYENLPLPNSGPMKALLPWCGHYEVQPALWAIAHTTQFAQPGWKYLDTSCGLFAGAGSFVALKSPKGKDFSLIIETIDAPAPQRLVCRLSGGLRAKTLHVWRSTEESQFDRLEDVPVISSCFTLLLEPQAIYSITTTSEQRKGMARRIPSAAPFPFPYTDDFEQTPVGKMPRYFADQGGVFEVAERSDVKGHCLRQTITLRGIDWNPHPTPEPYTMLGSTQWRNYEVSCDVLVEKAGSVGISGRIVRSRQTADPPLGYRLNVSTDGNWELKAFTNTLASGKIAFAADVWHNLKLRFRDSTIAPVIDGAEQPSLTDSTFAAGMAGLASGWNAAQFDNFTARPLEPSQRFNLSGTQ